MGNVSRTIRDKLFVDSGHRCTICAEKAYEIHHIIEQGDGGGHEEDNLIVLCPNCHQHRHHRHGEFTTSQLRMYKQKLKENNEVERRLVMNLDEIRENLALASPDERERRLREVIEQAAATVSEDRAPVAAAKVEAMSRWLAERELLKGGARQALEIEYEIAWARERAKFEPTVSVVGVDENSWAKADEFEHAYSIEFLLNRVPSSEWLHVFEHEFKSAFYLMKRRTRVRGDRIKMIVGEYDNLQQHADFVKQLVASTNSYIMNTALPEAQARIEIARRQALNEFDTVRSLRERTRGIKI